MEEGGCLGYLPPLPGFQPVDSHFLHPEYKDQATNGSLPHRESMGFFSSFLIIGFWRKRTRHINVLCPFL